jgi:hypothetical protein
MMPIHKSHVESNAIVRERAVAAVSSAGVATVIGSSLPPPSYGGGGLQGRRGKAAVESSANLRS